MQKSRKSHHYQIFKGIPLTDERSLIHEPVDNNTSFILEPFFYFYTS